jgi:glycosyltransferase involved in cell wall biosynthesis
MNDYWGNARLNQFSSYQRHDLKGARVLIGVGSLGISGGTNLILQYATALADSGADVTLGIINGNASDISWNQKIGSFRVEKLSRLKDSRFDLGIMTWWPTVSRMLDIDCSRYLYFVQSLESRFALNYQDSQEKYEAAATYMLGLPTVTIASWLQNLLMSQTSSKVWCVKNGINKTIFPVSSGPSEPETQKLTVLVEGALDVPMKGLTDTLKHLSEIEDIDVWHVNPINSRSAFSDRTINQVPIGEMSKIYSQVDVIVKMSRVEGMFGPPLEAFHSGATAIVSKVTGYDEYIKNEYNALVVEIDDFEGMKNAVRELSHDRELLYNLKVNALKTASEWQSSELSKLHFVSVVFSVLSSPNLGKVNRNDLKSLLKAYTHDKFFPVAFLGI